MDFQSFQQQQKTYQYQYVKKYNQKNHIKIFNKFDEIYFEKHFKIHQFGIDLKKRYFKYIIEFIYQFLIIF